MIDDTLLDAIRTALRAHEIGTASPYRLFFASKAKSGASFGFMQGDLNAGQPEVREAFLRILAAAGVTPQVATSLLKRLSGHLIANPLNPSDTELVNKALLAGRDIVDKMDNQILASVLRSLKECIEAASPARTIEPKALIYMALWINMSGRPTRLLEWLRGKDPHLPTPIAPAPKAVDGAAMEAYLRATSYYSENPQNFAHMKQCAAKGAEELAGPGKVAAMGAEAALVSEPETYFEYEQATGRIFLVGPDGRDLIGVGYSGSEAGGGKNDPKKQCEQDIGPIPRGRYRIGAPRQGPSPYSLPLTPAPDNDMCGRSAFLIHGDSIAHPGTASHGCIIMQRSYREHIAAAVAKDLKVIAHLP